MTYEQTRQFTEKLRACGFESSKNSGRGERNCFTKKILASDKSILYLVNCLIFNFNEDEASPDKHTPYLGVQYNIIMMSDLVKLDRVEITINDDDASPETILDVASSLFATLLQKTNRL